MNCTCTESQDLGTLYGSRQAKGEEGERRKRKRGVRHFLAFQPFSDLGFQSIPHEHESISMHKELSDWYVLLPPPCPHLYPRIYFD